MHNVSTFGPAVPVVDLVLMHKPEAIANIFAGSGEIMKTDPEVLLITERSD